MFTLFWAENARIMCASDLLSILKYSNATEITKIRGKINNNRMSAEKSWKLFTPKILRQPVDMVHKCEKRCLQSQKKKKYYIQHIHMAHPTSFCSFHKFWICIKYIYHSYLRSLTVPSDSAMRSHSVVNAKIILASVFLGKLFHIRFRLREYGPHGKKIK